jgi:hypothetical protein
MLMMADPGSGRWWWSGPGVGTMRRRGMGRRPARLMYAGFHRRSAVRQEGAPHQRRPARGWWHSRAGDRSCSGGAQLGTPGTCWCSVAPKDLSDAAPWPRTSLQTGWGHIGATLGPPSHQQAGDALATCGNPAGRDPCRPRPDEPEGDCNPDEAAAFAFTRPRRTAGLKAAGQRRLHRDALIPVPVRASGTAGKMPTTRRDAARRQAPWALRWVRPTTWLPCCGA